MATDSRGIELVYVIYDRSKSKTRLGWHRVATFRELHNATAFFDKEANEDYVISCQIASTRDLSLARD